MTVYRQYSHRLRVQRGPGNADLVSERANKGKNADGNWVYTDSDKNPTLIEFDELCQVDIPQLLATGAITEHAPAKKRKGAK